MSELLWARVRLTLDDKVHLRRASAKAGGFQSVAHRLQRLWYLDGGKDHVNIPSTLFKTITQYAENYGDGGWQRVLRRIAEQLPPLEPDAPAPTQSDLFGGGE